MGGGRGSQLFVVFPLVSEGRGLLRCAGIRSIIAALE